MHTVLGGSNQDYLPCQASDPRGHGYPGFSDPHRCPASWKLHPFTGGRRALPRGHSRKMRVAHVNGRTRYIPDGVFNPIVYAETRNWASRGSVTPVSGGRELTAGGRAPGCPDRRGGLSFVPRAPAPGWWRKTPLRHREGPEYTQERYLYAKNI